MYMVSLRGNPEARSSPLEFFTEAESLAATQDDTEGLKDISNHSNYT